MARSTYGSYRGRKNWGKRILIGFVVVLALLLLLAVVGVVFLRDYIVYTDNGIEFTLPFGRKEPSQTEPPAPTSTPGREELVVEQPTPTPTPTPVISSSTGVRPSGASRRG